MSEMPQTPPPTPTPPLAPPLVIKRPSHWRSLLLFLPIPIVLWAAEFLYQYYVLVPDDLKSALVRTEALTGATLISAALFCSAIFKWFPRTAKHWRFRRHLGVSGVFFITLHILAVLNFYFDFDLSEVYYSWNPLENPIVFATIAYPIFLLMAMTSTDWATKKLGGRRWKNIHRLVYLAEIGMIFHFITIDFELLKNPAGYLLLTMASLAVLGQVYWYFRTAARQHFRTRGALIGALLILLFVGTAYAAYDYRSDTSGTADDDASLENAVDDMKEAINAGGDPDVATTPLPEEQDFAAPIVRSGQFQNLNYMTSGGVMLEDSNGTPVIVFDETFTTPNGPDLVVYLTKNTAPTERDDIRAGIQLGELKSTNGKQVYVVPTGTDISEFNSVSIHCRAFNVPWSYAVLE